MGPNHFFSNSSRVEFSSPELDRVEFLVSNFEPNRTEANQAELRVFFEFHPLLLLFSPHLGFKKIGEKISHAKFFKKYYFFQRSKKTVFLLQLFEHFWLVNFGSNFKLLRTSKTRCKNSNFRTRTKFGPMSNQI